MRVKVRVTREDPFVGETTSVIGPYEPEAMLAYLSGYLSHGNVMTLDVAFEYGSKPDVFELINGGTL